MILTKKVRKAIKEAILNYCEGITHVEFNVNDLDNMVDDIEKVIEEN